MSESSTPARWAFVIAIVLAFVLAPFVLWGAELSAWVDAFVRDNHSPGVTAAVLAGLLAADVVLPIPSSITMVAAGVALGTVGGALTSTAGMSVGCVVGYGLGHRLGRPGVRRLVDDAQLLRVEHFAARWGDLVLVALRPVPVLAEATTIFAGLARVAPLRFLLLCTVANAVIATTYASLGDLAADTGRHDLGVLAALGIPALAMLAARVLQTRTRAADHRSAQQRKPVE